ncbi:hypothetical protein NMG60_11008974 [Bertholletia excelsa]
MQMLSNNQTGQPTPLCPATQHCSLYPFPMAAAVSLSFSFEPQPHHHCHVYSITPYRSHHPLQFLPPKHSLPLALFPKSSRYNLTLSLSTSYCSSSSSSSTSASTLQDPFSTGRFLTNEELEKLQLLQNFSYYQELKSGSLLVRVMKAVEIDLVVALLSESFAESLLLPEAYVTVLGFLVKQYLTEKKALMPHTATLIGFYREDEDEQIQLAGTVEVCFDRRGANASPPTPTPPKDKPYVCNMTVKKQLRRRGIGWHLLKASEELISQMSSSREIYLHCRIIDSAPLNMYAKAGYSIVKTDSILVLLTLQRRKHLMCKELSIMDSPSEFCNSSEEPAL